MTGIFCIRFLKGTKSHNSNRKFKGLNLTQIKHSQSLKKIEGTLNMEATYDAIYNMNLPHIVKTKNFTVIKNVQTCKIEDKTNKHQSNER
ncbi:hypothetical protein Hanom_Chr11g01015921 [Helianthus anomalus]